MRTRYLIILTILPFIGFSQTYKRNFYEYEKLKIDTISNCNEEILQNLEKSFVFLQENC